MTSSYPFTCPACGAEDTATTSMDPTRIRLRCPECWTLMDLDSPLDQVFGA